MMMQQMMMKQQQEFQIFHMKQAQLADFIYNKNYSRQQSHDAFV